jgi:cell division protein FtsB
VAPSWSFLRRSWFAVAALVVAAILLVSAAWSERGLSRVLQLRTELAETEDRNFRLVQQISALRRDVEMARTDDATLEHLARRYLGMARPGEVIYRVPPLREARDGGAEVWADERGPAELDETAVTTTAADD